MSLLTRVAAVSPFGPIFAKELRTTARRKRSYVLRVGYLGVLLVALLLAWLTATNGRGRMSGGLAARAQQQSELGMIFFGVFSMFCVITMGLIGPVLTATAIGSERLAKTLPVLLMTPINTWQIIGGKLFSRLLAALTLLGLSLPVLALVRLLGGVELEQMVAVLCLCTSFAMGCAAIGLFYSSMMNRAYAVILLSYATLGFLYAMLPFLIVAGFALHRDRDIFTFLAAINPVLSTIMQINPRMMQFSPNGWVYATVVQLALTAVLVLGSGLMLRRSARRAGERPAAVDPASYIPMAAPVATASPTGPPPLPGAPPALAVVPYAGPKTAAERRAAKVRDVSDHPILWRELRRPLLARRWQQVVAVVACAALLLLVYGVMANDNDLGDPDGQIGFAIIFHGLAWLLLAVLSATAIASEKESDTWTLLLATPVSGSAVVWGKVAGLLRRLVWPLALVTAHFALFAATGIVHVLTIPLVLWVIVSFNSVWVATGLWLSLRVRKVTFAVIANLLLAVVVYLAPVVLLAVVTAVFDWRSHDVVEQGGWHVPYVYLAGGMEGLNHYMGRRVYSVSPSYYETSRFFLPGQSHVSAEAFFGVVFVVGALHLLVAWQILSRTAAAFDRIVGRAGRQAYTGTFDTDDAVIPVSARAPLARRAAAALVDGLILRSGGVILGLLGGVIAVVSQAGEIGSERQALDVVGQWAIGGVLFSFAAGWVYYVAFESSARRATPGKALVGLFVTDPDGRRISFGRASLRYAVRLASGALLGAGYVMALFSPTRQAMHDRAAGTFVLRR